MTHARRNEFSRYAQITADDDAAQWLDPGMPLPEGNIWDRSEFVPAPGSERLVYVYCDRQMPLLVNQERWMLFIPGAAALNGWEEHPETIGNSAFVRCRLRAVERAGPEAHRQWLRVEVAEIVPFADLEQKFPPHIAERLETWELSTGALTRDQDWELWDAPHDDAGFWLLARVRGDNAHVVAGGEWLYGANNLYDRAWGGHVVIPLAQWRRICLAGEHS